MIGRLECLVTIGVMGLSLTQRSGFVSVFSGCGAWAFAFRRTKLPSAVHACDNRIYTVGYAQTYESFNLKQVEVGNFPSTYPAYTITSDKK